MFRKNSKAILVGLDCSNILLDICKNDLKRISALKFTFTNRDATENKYDYGKNKYLLFIQFI